MTVRKQTAAATEMVAKKIGCDVNDSVVVMVTGVVAETQSGNGEK